MNCFPTLKFGQDFIFLSSSKVYLDDVYNFYHLGINILSFRASQRWKTVQKNSDKSLFVTTPTDQSKMEKKNIK